MHFSDLKIKWKIILAASLFIPISIGLTIYNFNRIYALEVRTALNGLMNFTDAKQQGIIRFIGANEKLAKQLALLVNQAPTEVTGNYFAEIVATDTFRLEDHPFRKEIEAGQRHIPTWQVYHAIDYVDNGTIVISSDPSRVGRRMGRVPDLRHGYSDVYMEGDIPVLTFGSPSGHGMVYIHADARMLTTIVNGEIGNLEGGMGAFYLAGVGKSFDYYLVNKDNLLITESRVFPDALLKRRGSEFPWKATQQNPSLGILCNARGVYTTNAGSVTGCHEAMGFYQGVDGKLMLGTSMPFYDSGWTLVVEQEADELLMPLTLLRNSMFLFIVAAGLTSFLIFVAIVNRYISHPLRQLMSAIGMVKQTGDLSHQANISGNDEVGQTAQAFNAVVSTLHAEKERQKELNKDLKESHDQLMQSEKMASIGQLAAGVAHEINNPIGYVYSNLGTLEKYVQDVFSMIDSYEQAEGAIADEAVRTRLQAARKKLDIAFLKEDLGALMSESMDGITRVKNIVQNLKDFSHVDAADEWHFADLHKGLDSTLNIVNNEIKYKADVVREYGDIPEVECLPSQLNQVFMNLLVNAAHAIEERGTITVRTGQQGDEVWVEVADTGKGIAPENLKKIFDPFFTTKPIGKGTGLGLSLSYGIVQKHHGRIEVRSEPGKGTIFKVWLPVVHSGSPLPALNGDGALLSGAQDFSI